MSNEHDQNIKLTLDKNEIEHLIGSLYEKDLDNKRYAESSEVSVPPAETDTCCQAHIARYQRNLEIHTILLKRIQETQDLIKKLEDLISD